MKTRKHGVTALRELTLAVAVSLAPAATLWADSAQIVAPPPLSMAAVQSAYGHLPLSFEANHGQVDAQVKFLARGKGYTLFLTPTESVIVLQQREAPAEQNPRAMTDPMALSKTAPIKQAVVRMKLEGTNPSPAIDGMEQLPGIVNYFIGNDSAKWRTNIPTYQKVGYTNVYPGVDLVYYGNQGKLEYDLIVAPGADPAQIRLAFDGAERIQLDQHGDLVLTVPQSSTERASGDAATLRLHKPVVYQRDEHGDKHLLAGTYVLLTSETSLQRPASTVLHPSETTHPSSLSPHVAFQVASYDASKPLIIDPVLSWATYLGGSDYDQGFGIAVDQAGNAYVTGQTTTPGSGFPGTAGSLIQSTCGCDSNDAFVTKLNAAGTALVYSTYLGGSGVELAYGIAVDQTGNAYVTGVTTSTNFPLATALQSTFGGGNDAFVTKLNAAGTALVYSTYLGGSLVDAGYGITVDQAGQVYVTGGTNTPGSGFPGTAGSSIQSTLGGDSDAFVAKLNAAGTALVYSTYLGGSSNDVGYGIAVDQAGNACVTGWTTTPGSGFPGTAGSSIQSTLGDSSGDAFVTKLNAAGTALVYSTYLGGGGVDQGQAIAVDQGGNAYVTGTTGAPGSGFPGTADSSIQSTLGGGTDAFVTKLNAAGTALVYSTYLGGSGNDAGYGIAVDQAGNAYVNGFTQTTGSGFPGTVSSSIQSTFGGSVDAFVTKLNAAGTALVYSTYLGGSGIDYGYGIAVDQAGNAYVTGHTNTPGSGFPGTAGSSIQSTLGGDYDAFVAKITTNDSPVCSAAQANPTALWSPNHQFVPIAILGVTDPENEPVTLTILGVRQDEPVLTPGRDTTSPDAVIQTGTASVRAERLDTGNGRVYQISFTADDGKGGSCTGAVNVSVPHSLKKGSIAVDDGPVYDSTIP